MELSRKFWKIKDNKRTTNITCEILGRHQAHNLAKWSLYLNKKLKIVLHRENNMLNKQTEISNKCTHKKKYVMILYFLKNFL